MKIHTYIYACIIWIGLLGASNALHAQAATPRVVTAADQVQMLAAKEAYLKEHPTERIKAEASVAKTSTATTVVNGEQKTNAWGIGENYDAQRKLELFQSGNIDVIAPTGVHTVDRNEYVTMPKARQEIIKANPSLYKLEDTKRGL